MKIKQIFIVFFFCFNFSSCFFLTNLISDNDTTYNGIRYTWLFYIPKSEGIVYEIENQDEYIPMAIISDKKSKKEKHDFYKDGYDCFWISHNQVKNNPKNFSSKIKIKVVYCDGDEEVLETRIDINKLHSKNDSEPKEIILSSKKYKDGIKCVFDYWFS